MTAAVQAAELIREPYWYRLLPPGEDVHPLGDGLIAVTGNEAVHEALTHPAIVAEHPLKASARVLGPNVLDADGPEHRAFRALLAPALSGSRIQDYRRRLMPGLIESLISDLHGMETSRFSEAYAHRVPYGIICAILGIEACLEERLHALTRPLASLLDYPTVETEETHANVAELLAIIEQQRAEGSQAGDSLLETIERTRDRKGIRLTDAEIRSTALLFFIAGTETSSAFITSLVYCMGRLIFGLDELRDQAIRDDFIEEVLRLFPPVQTVVRFAEDDLSIAGVDVKRHSAVLASIAGANRDPRIFKNPDRFTLARNRKTSIPFAAGSHVCPGSSLAKTEFGLLVECFVKHFSEISVVRDGRRMASQSFSHPVDFTIRFTQHK